MPVYERLGDTRSTAVAWSRIADIAYQRGDLDEALRIRQEVALPVYERLGDTRSAAVTWGKIADIAHRRGDVEKAVGLRSRSLDSFRAIEDIEGIASDQWALARIDLARQDQQAAAPRLAEAFGLLQQLGRPDALAVVGHTLGQLLADHRHPQARDVLTVAHTAATTTGQTELGDAIAALLSTLDPTPGHTAPDGDPTP